MVLHDIMPIDYEGFDKRIQELQQKHIERHGGLYMINGKPIESIFELWEWHEKNSETEAVIKP